MGTSTLLAVLVMLLGSANALSRAATSHSRLSDVTDLAELGQGAWEGVMAGRRGKASTIRRGGTADLFTQGSFTMSAFQGNFEEELGEAQREKEQTGSNTTAPDDAVAKAAIAAKTVKAIEKFVTKAATFMTGASPDLVASAVGHLCSGWVKQKGCNDAFVSQKCKVQCRVAHKGPGSKISDSDFNYNAASMTEVPEGEAVNQTDPNPIGSGEGWPNWKHCRTHKIVKDKTGKWINGCGSKRLLGCTCTSCVDGAALLPLYNKAKTGYCVPYARGVGTTIHQGNFTDPPDKMEQNERCVEAQRDLPANVPGSKLTMCTKVKQQASEFDFTKLDPIKYKEAVDHFKYLLSFGIGESPFHKGIAYCNVHKQLVCDRGSCKVKKAIQCDRVCKLERFGAPPISFRKSCRACKGFVGVLACDAVAKMV